MKKLIFAVSLLFTMVVRADLMVIGDSHMAGIYGTFLHKELANIFPDEAVMVYGHASSAPIHWIGDIRTKLAGGVSHHFSHKKLYLYMPKELKQDWKVPQETPQLMDLLDDPVKYSFWKYALQRKPELDTVVIELGANDRKIISDEEGNPTAAYDSRVRVLDDMISSIVSRGLKCIWVSQPGSVKRNPNIEVTTLKYLKQGIAGRCPIYDSTKFIAKDCDGIHFNCPKAFPIARQWASEVAEFIQAHRQ